MTISLVPALVIDFVSFFTGGLFGILLMCIMAMAKRGNEEPLEPQGRTP